MPPNTYGRQVVIPLVNKSGAGVIAGDVVVIDTANNGAFTTNAAGSFTGGVGIAQETIASLATGRVLLSGYAALVSVNAAVTRGNFGKTFTVVKQATDAGAARTVGTFCQFLTAGTAPDAVIFQTDLQGAALVNPMTTKGDLIAGGTAGAATRLAVGTNGQVLTADSTQTSGQKWAAPTTVYHDTTLRTVTNTVVETTVFPNQSIAGGTLGLTGGFRVTLIGNLTHNQLGVCTIRIYYGATVIASLACAEGALAGSKPTIFRSNIINLGAQNSQQFGIDAYGQDGAGPGTAAVAYARVNTGTAAADTSATGNFSITAQWNIAGAALFYYQYAAIIEVLT